MSQIEISGDFRLWNFAENQILVTLKTTEKYVSMTGAEVTKQLIVPFAHRIVKIIMRHTTTADVDSIDPLDIQIRRDVGQISDMPALKDILQTQADLVDSAITLTFGEGFEYEPTTWILSFNATATDRVYIMIYLQRLGGKR